MSSNEDIRNTTPQHPHHICSFFSMVFNCKSASDSFPHLFINCSCLLILTEITSLSSWFLQIATERKLLIYKIVRYRGPGTGSFISNYYLLFVWILPTNKLTKYVDTDSFSFPSIAFLVKWLWSRNWRAEIDS